MRYSGSKSKIIILIDVDRLIVWISNPMDLCTRLNYKNELGYPNQTFLRSKSDNPIGILLIDSFGWFYDILMYGKIFHLVRLEIHANQMWLHSISSLIGNSVGVRGTLWVTRLWRIPIGMAGDVKVSEKLEVL